jgi:hypothetical protein
MTVIALRPRPPGWDLLEQAIAQRQTIKARYHGRDRLLCPHLLGWRNGRAKLLSYQLSTGADTPTDDPRQQWRAMFVDELVDPLITDDPWLSAPNYTANATGIDVIEIAVRLS